MIACGWCGKATRDGPRCGVCGHIDPRRPWEQRGEPVPVTETHDGRPVLTPAEMRRRLGVLGPAATVDQIAEHFDVDPRTVRRWRAKVSA
jgi:hypothetical protein